MGIHSHLFQLEGLEKVEKHNGKKGKFKNEEQGNAFVQNS